ncbi:Uncharacterised protein [Salmonella enterica subsp. arizonae]|uniref:Uncharacterized protein n=1 Tax=Salmonella enterica subsp. arizonae TaxID=59203 RepID=A0A379TQP4_SALER|nr:Uncharacterised protein [Salmonella enterica subsp. arizonae]
MHLVRYLTRPVDLTQALFIILIVGILAAVAQTRSPSYFFGDFRALFTPEIIELLFECFVPFAGDQGRFHLVDVPLQSDIAHMGYNVIIPTE